MSRFFEIECGYEEPVVIERTEEDEFVFHNFDYAAEQAAEELGFDPSLCSMLYWNRHDFELGLYDEIRDGQSDHNLELTATLIELIHALAIPHDKVAMMRVAVEREMTETFKLLLQAGYPVSVWMLDEVKRKRRSGAPIRGIYGWGNTEMLRFLRDWLEEHSAPDPEVFPTRRRG
jgi:hypothetical protein